MTSKRRNLLTQMGENMASEVALALKGSPHSAECSAWLRDQLHGDEQPLAQPADWFNHDENLLSALGSIVEAKSLALARGLVAGGAQVKELLAQGCNAILKRASLCVAHAHHCGMSLQVLADGAARGGLHCARVVLGGLLRR